MKRFTALSPKQILNRICKSDIVVKRNPRAATLYNIAKLSLQTTLNKVVPTHFFAFDGNEGEDEFLIAKQDFSKFGGKEPIRWILWPKDFSPTSVGARSSILAFENLVDWTIPCSFTDVQLDMAKTIGILCDKHGTGFQNGPYTLHCLDIDNALQFSDEEFHHRSNNITVRDLTKKDIAKLIANWKYANEGSVNEVPYSASIVGSAGVCVDGELVSWAYASIDGFIHAVHTEENHRGKGYAKIVLKKLAKILVGKGLYPVTQVEEPHVVKLMVRHGFRVSSASAMWIDYVPSKEKPRQRFINSSPINN